MIELISIILLITLLVMAAFTVSVFWLSFVIIKSIADTFKKAKND